MIRMGKEVGNEEVIIPHHTVGEVTLQRTQGGLGKVGIDGIAVEQLYGHIDTRHFGSSLPVAFLHRQRHRGVGEYQFRPFLLPGPFPRVVLVARLAPRQTQFHQRPVTIGLVFVIVACKSPAHRGKGTEFLVKPIVGIETGLQ